MLERFRPGSGAPSRRCDVGQIEAVQVMAHVVAGLLPDRQKDALSFMVARPVGMGLAEVAEGDRAVHRRHDVGETDVGRLSGERVATSDPSLRPHETGPFQGQENLLEIRLGESGSFGDVAHRRRPRLAFVQRETEKGSTGIVPTGRHAHPDIVGGGGEAAVGSVWWTVVMEFPSVPDRQAPRLGSIVPGCLLSAPGRRPSWFPPALQTGERIVLIVVDGLGWRQLLDHRSSAPHLSDMEATRITTVAPSTTATALTSLVTGAEPRQHGILGYRIDFEGTVMNTLSWFGGRSGERRNLRHELPPSSVQPVPPFCGRRVPVVTRAEHLGTAFTEAHLAGTELRGWRSPSSIVVEIEEALDADADFVYAYYDGVDKIAHERGFGSFYEAELRLTDHLVAEICARVPSGTTVAVVADHGQVQTGDDVVQLDDDVMRLVDHQSGEGRFRWLHARDGRTDELMAACRRYSSFAWVLSRDEVVATGWFGDSGDPSFLRRLGDVALVPFSSSSFDDPDDSGHFPLVCRHGSLTDDEILVPLLALRT